MINTKGILRSVVLAAVMALPASVVAQPPPPPPSTPPPSTPPTGGAAGTTDNPDMQATLRNEGGRRVYVASATIEVQGQIQRPYAFSVSGRSSLGYTYFEQPIHFVREILDAVRRAPF